MTTLAQDILDGLNGKRPNPLPQAEGMMPEQAFIIKKHQLLELLTPASEPAGGGMREAAVSVMASLAAAISLLERTPKAKKAAPSDRMFDQMLRDYRKALDEARAAMHLMTRWVKTAERQPTVGGSYITGDYVEDGTLPRRFDRSHNRYMIILESGPTWRELEEDIHGRQIDRTIEPPEYWLENMPPHPEYVP